MPANTIITTLTSAIGIDDVTFVIGSTTGMTASAVGAPTYIVIDQDVMPLVAIPVAGTVTVKRQSGAGNPVPHSAGVYVAYGKFGGWSPRATGSGAFVNFLSGSTHPTGAADRTASEFLPVFNPSL